MLPNQRLKNIAGQQHGYFTARQALSAGFAKYLHSYHTKNGHWQRIDRALYRLPGFADTAESAFVRWTLWAAGQSQIRQAVISHESALHAYGLLPDAPPAVHLCVSSLRRQADNRGCVLHWRTLAPEEFNEQKGYALTTPARTLLDLRPDLTYRGIWEATVAAALARGLLGATQAEELTGNRPLQTSDQRTDCAATTMGGGLADRAPARGGQRREATMPMRSSGGWSRQARSFTLVEMLVVIAILCVLAGMLLPALGRAVDSARTSQCGNNQRQCGIALTCYADDNAGYIVVHWVIPNPAPYQPVEKAVILFSAVAMPIEPKKCD